MTKSKNPTAKRVSNGNTLKAHLAFWNGHAWRVCISTHDDMWDDEDGISDDISIGNGSDPEEAIEHAISELEDMIDALRKHAVNLNERHEAHLAKWAAKAPTP